MNVDNILQRNWYGDTFPLVRNPFFTAVSMEQRPPTPRKGTITVLIDGKPVEQHSDSQSLERDKEMVAYNAMKRVIFEETPKWCPNVDVSYLPKVRNAEKMLIKEVDLDRLRMEKLKKK